MSCYLIIPMRMYAMTIITLSLIITCIYLYAAYIISNVFIFVDKSDTCFRKYIKEEKKIFGDNTIMLI